MKSEGNEVHDDLRPSKTPASMEPLDARLARGAFEFDEVERIVRLLALQVDVRHARGEVDGALSPSRIRVDASLTYLRILPRDPDSRVEKAYTAPETWDGELTTASDIFSVAAILYEALCGGRAFPGDDSQRIRTSIVAMTPIPPAVRVPGLTRDVDHVFEKAFSPEISNRYISCSAFAEALCQALEDSRKAINVLIAKPLSRPPSRISLTPRRSRKLRSRLHMLELIVWVVVFILLVVFFFLFSRSFAQ